jgi:hypothetical protein
MSISEGMAVRGAVVAVMAGQLVVFPLCVAVPKFCQSNIVKRLGLGNDLRVNIQVEPGRIVAAKPRVLDAFG